MSADEVVPGRPGDRAADLRVLLTASGVIGAGYGWGASLQSWWIYSMFVPEWADVDLWRRLLVNGLAVGALVAGLWLVRVHTARRADDVAVRLVAAATAMSLLRVTLQVVLGVYDETEAQALQAEFVTGTAIALVASSIGTWAMLASRRARGRTRAAERTAMSVELAVRALEDEEVRVRRSVAEGLHGTLQQRLVVVDAQLEEIVRTADPEAAEAVRRVRAELSVARETDVRNLSRLLYPERLEMGLVPAARSLLARVPVSIATRIRADAEVRALDDPARPALTTAERLLAVRVVEEAVTNALKHGPPTRIDVELDLDGVDLVVVVTSDGAPFDVDAERDPSSGGARLQERVRLAGGSFAVLAGPGLGARVQARLPVAALRTQAAG